MFSVRASTPSLLNPRRLISASASGIRNRRGLAFPGWARGVTAPISRKPNPRAPSPSMCLPSLSSPAASPTGFGKSRPITRTGTLGERAAAGRRDKACAILPRRERAPGSGMNLFGRELSPGAVDEAFDRLEMRLVGHLAAVLDPITEIQIGQGGAAALLDLPQDVVGAQARAGGVGIVKSVDRGKPVAELVDDRYHHELALVAELHQPRAHPALQQEMRVLVAAVLVHAAAGMPARLITKIERVVLDAKAQPRHRVLQTSVLCEGAPLAARGAKLLDGDAHRNAGAAVIAVGPVGKDAAAAKAEPHEVRVEFGADQMAGSRHLRARHPARQIAAGVRCSHIELQYGMRQIVQLRHCTCATDAPDQLPGGFE